jgi:glycosyltransferase involved in cell wall biosynthesis
MTPWLLVAGDLTPLGGMDAANHALARFLGRRGSEVHLVTHRAWPDLSDLPHVTVHRVWRPFNRHLLGSPLLSRAGLRVWRRLRSRGARAVVNGGNCRVAAANWVHYLHAAYSPAVNGSASRRVKDGLARRRDLDAERRALQAAHVVICNSRRTRQDVVDRMGIADDRVEVVYYGSDPMRFGSVGPADRLRAKAWLNRPADRPLVGFVGALGDRRKAFDTVFDAWTALCRRPDWDADLIVVGGGAEQPAWRRRADAAGLAGRMHFLGFRADVPAILAALDALVHPARYEAYGLSVHEALCRGVVALVTASAGVAELYPPELGELLIQNPDDANELAERLLVWRRNHERLRAAVAPLSARLLSRTWDAMAEQIVDCVERTAVQTP